MDMLGVNVVIKEEIPDDTHDAGTSRTNRSSASEPIGDTPLSSKADPQTPEQGPPADSLESPSAQRNQGWAHLKCVFCNQNLTSTEGTPKLMECLHSACEGCVRAKIDERPGSGRDFLGASGVVIVCATCKLQCEPAKMIDQRFVIEKVTAENSNNTVAGEHQCNSCSDENIATSYCVDCGEFICDVCVQAHQRLKITKDHTIKSKDEAVNELQAQQNSCASTHEMYCKEHTQERLSLFCETCDRLTCRDCQLLHHRDHKYQFSSEMAAQARAAINTLLSEVSYKRVLLGSAMKVINDRQSLIADKKKDLVHEITQTVVNLTNTINTRGKQLVLRLNEVCDSKQKTLSEKKQALEQLSAITDHTIEFVNAALEQGSDTAVLYSKKQVTQHLQRIKSRRADIPNPEIPVRISLALDKVPELMKDLSSIGGIVVDGKYDAGPSSPAQTQGGHSQGPYHPPVPALPPAPPHPPHSAVLALQQHVHMQQNYVNSRSGGASPSGAPPPYTNAVMTQLQQMHAARQNAAAGNAMQVAMAAVARAGNSPALRHPHVTSTTHPHHPSLQVQQRQQYARQNQAMQQAYQQAMGAYASGAYAARPQQQARGPRTPSPAPPLYPAPAPPAPQATPPAKWHIPQHNAGNINALFDGTGFLPGGAQNNDFKITLSRQQMSRQTSATSAVTSTNPKTPSPSLNGGASSEATVSSLDKLCAESVQDLMATIAKLDSNGVQVLPEHAPAPSPHVHSSTDENPNKNSMLPPSSAVVQSGTGDPNEDWCAVCMDGGELMCCDKCPKVFHQYCHIPTIDKLPEEAETWQCLLCVNFSELPPEVTPGDRRGVGLTPRQQKVIERIVLELYCQYETSLPFREPVPLDNVDYHSKINRPMALDTIRLKLQPRCAERYTHVAQMIADVRLMFRNAYSYNPPDSQIYSDAKRLEEFFDQQLEKWLPDYAYYDPGSDEHLNLPNKRPKYNGI